ncbi:hypothetical protein ACLML9_20750, partial [Nocardia sp. NPDC002869]
MYAAAAVEFAVAEFGRVDVVVNNAGYSAWSPFRSAGRVIGPISCGGFPGPGRPVCGSGERRAIGEAVRDGRPAATAPGAAETDPARG